MTTPRAHFRVCNLCEAMCGIAIEVEGDRIVSIRGDDDDSFSRGYICPKAVALQDVHGDPDRLRGWHWWIWLWRWLVGSSGSQA